MKKLIICLPEGAADTMWQEGPPLQRVLNEITKAGVYSVVGLVGNPGSPSDIPCFQQVESIPLSTCQGSTFFVCDDTYSLNQRRLAAYLDIKRRGWPLASLCAKGASVADGVRLRENVYIDDAVRVLPGANIGANSWIMRGSELGAGSKLGSSSFIGSDCRISEGAVIGKNCTLGSGVVIGKGVTLPAWSVINRRVTLTTSPTTAVFIDPLFVAPVHLFN